MDYGYVMYVSIMGMWACMCVCMWQEYIETMTWHCGTTENMRFGILFFYFVCSMLFTYVEQNWICHLFPTVFHVVSSVSFAPESIYYRALSPPYITHSPNVSCLHFLPLSLYFLHLSRIIILQRHRRSLLLCLSITTFQHINLNSTLISIFPLYMTFIAWMNDFLTQKKNGCFYRKPVRFNEKCLISLENCMFKREMPRSTENWLV